MRLVNVWFDIDRARTVDDLVKAQSRNQGVPWVNTIAADSRGAALYQDNSVVPAVDRKKIDTCIPAGLPEVVYQAAGVITLDGSRSSLWLGPRAWRGASLASSRRRHLPILKRRDYVQNSNDSYWYTNPERPLTGFSPIIGSEGTELGLRTRYGLQTIAARLAGTDGLPGRKYTLGRLRPLWERDDSEAGRLVKNQLAALCEANPSIVVDGQPVDVRAACPVFRSLGRNRATRQQGRLAVRRLVAAVGDDLLRPVRPECPAHHAQGPRHERRQRHGDRRRGEEPARSRPAARRLDAPSPVRAQARQEDPDPRLRQRLLPGHRGRDRPGGRERDPGRARPLRPGGRGLEHRDAGRADRPRPEGHHDPHLFAVGEPALVALGRPDQAVLGRQVGPDQVHQPADRARSEPAALHGSRAAASARHAAGGARSAPAGEPV